MPNGAHVSLPKAVPSYVETKHSEDDDEARSFLHRSYVRHYAVKNHKTLTTLTVLNGVFFFLTGVFFSVWFHERYVVRNADIRRTSSYSPILDMVDLGGSIKKFNGTLFPPKHPSLGRQMPNAAADQIWEELELTRVLPVSRADIIRMGKDPSTVAKLEDSVWGLGDDAYVTVLDVYHHLHCLNSLRRIAYGAYYSEEMGNATRASMTEIHINHCVDMLAQALQCSGNVNLITMHWVETQVYPFPDMSVNRKCIDFEKLTEWRRENTIDMDKYVEVMKKPDGVAQLPAPDALYAYHGSRNPNHEGGKDMDKDFNL